MAKVHTLRRRIKSVKNINQITKAMELVSASKLRRAQEATLRSRLYATASRELLGELRQVTSTAAHPLFVSRPVARRLVILFSSDRGLAGAYNSNVFKMLLALLQTSGTAQKVSLIKLIVVGTKGAQFVSRLKTAAEVIGVYTNWPTQPSMVDVRPLVKTAVDLYQSGEVDEVSVLFTDFISSVRQVVTRRTILPVASPADGGAGDLDTEDDIPAKLFEPSPAAVLQYVVPRFIETQVYQAALEASASEQSMRMMAMKNASDNAKDITHDLTLTYNGARQAAITQELAEITAGAEAMA